jgi:aryl-alcohol dehydrogenase-like predicted oxidoreductase
MSDYYASKIGLGTAQWGMQYGISNRQGQTSPEEVKRILQAAHKAGISLLDTACLYGNAEQVLGGSDLTAYRVITKTPKFRNECILSTEADELVRTFHESLQKLGLNSTYGLLLHDVNNIFAPNGSRLVNALEQLKSQRLVSKIGISAYNSSQIHKTLDHFKPDIIQLPVNVLNQRLILDGTIAHLSQLGIEVHARSAFLQGLLLMNVNDIPKYFEPWMPILMRWHGACRNQLVSPLHAALGFVCSLKEITYTLVGIQNLSQLKEIIETSTVLDGFDFDQFSSNDANLLDPTFWSYQ